MAEPILQDDPADVAALSRTIADLDIVAHLNDQHGYTIPPPPFSPSVHAIRALQKEHAAIHVQQIMQEHSR